MYLFGRVRRFQPSDCGFGQDQTHGTYRDRSDQNDSSASPDLVVRLEALRRMQAPVWVRMRQAWNRTNGGVINGGASPTIIMERNNIGQTCAKFAGFARNLPNLLVTNRGANPLRLPNVRKFARNLRPPLLRYLLFLSERR